MAEKYPAHSPDGTSVFVSAADGLRLHARDYGPRDGRYRPVVCLPGLSRSAADFKALAIRLSTDAERPRRVLALDYRGRGLSEHDRDPTHYSLAVELSDVLTVMTALKIPPAIVIGASRGGLLAMLLASIQPGAMAGTILNDIGPVVEPAGLTRIKSYIGKLPPPENFEDGARILQRLFSAQFPKLERADWIADAKRTWFARDGRLVLSYDPKLSESLNAADLKEPLPDLWKEFDALAPYPLMAIRGALSDILSAQTLAAMQARHPGLEAVVVPDQGHPPLLNDEPLLARIARFAMRCDA